MLKDQELISELPQWYSDPTLPSYENGSTCLAHVAK